MRLATCWKYLVSSCYNLVSFFLKWKDSKNNVRSNKKYENWILKDKSVEIITEDGLMVSSRQKNWKVVAKIIIKV